MLDDTRTLSMRKRGWRRIAILSDFALCLTNTFELKTNLRAEKSDRDLVDWILSYSKKVKLILNDDRTTFCLNKEGEYYLLPPGLSSRFKPKIEQGSLFFSKADIEASGL